MKLGQSIPGYAVSILLLFCLACNSKPAAKEARAAPSPPEQSKTAQTESSQPQPPAQQPPAQQSPAPPKEEKTVSYAKNPERFAKVPTYEPPFNITNPKTAQEHFNVAVNDDHNNQIDKAIEEYQKTLEMKPDWAVAHFRIAQDYQKQGRTDDAIAHWELAARYDSQFYSAYDLLAGAYQRQGKIKKAIEAYSALLKYPPTEMPAHYQLGLWYAQIGDRQNARNHLESYRDLVLKSGSSESKSERFQKALHELQKLKQPS